MRKASVSTPRILVFQHIAAEHPGIFRDFLKLDGIAWDTVELDEGAVIPELDDYAALWVMGGPMDVWEEDQYPWLKVEKAAIREAVLERNMPYLGFCLGHQLLAAALGGEVGPAATPEIGILEIETTAAGRSSPFLQGLAPVMYCLQWHSSEVKKAPPGAAILARSAHCPIQALAVGSHALSVQYHVEITRTTVAEWGVIPAYQTALQKALGADALAPFEMEAKQHMGDFNRASRRLYRNWMNTAFAP
jgi:GMP synthase-like glutamine amidotransferase